MKSEFLCHNFPFLTRRLYTASSIAFFHFSLLSFLSMCIFFTSRVECGKAKRLNEGFFLLTRAQTAQLAANDSENYKISHMEIGKMHTLSCCARKKEVH